MARGVAAHADRAPLRAFYDVYTSCGPDDPNGPVVAVPDPVPDAMAAPVRGQLQGPRLFAGLWAPGDPAAQQTAAGVWAAHCWNTSGGTPIASC